MWRCELQAEATDADWLARAAGRLAARGVNGFALLDSAMRDAPPANDAPPASDAPSTRPGASDAGADDRRFATGRWSFLTLDPFGMFCVRAGTAFWNDAPERGPPLEALRARLAQYQLPKDPADPTPFRGGCIGVIAYDFAACLERLAPVATPSGVEQITLGFHDVVAALDHASGRLVIYASGFPEQGAAVAARAAARGALMRELLLEARGDELAASGAGGAGGAAPLRFSASHDRAAWVAAVTRVQEYIRAGDIFQANIARRFSAPLADGFAAFALYRALRAENPAPFAAFMDFGAACGGYAIASSSPERFIALRDDLAETRPIKGTARRADDPEADARAAAQLLASDKDRAENVMIVDLLRNDLSRVCAPHGVTVTALCALESYANVHHLVSVVQGRLAAGRDAIDLIAATFPGGSITGAPKIRAMDIISEIEGRGRGAYCGAIGYLGFDGDIDLNIAIRTIVIHEGEASFHAGGGVTLLSDPDAEFDETNAKAARLFSAVDRLQRGEPCC